MVNSSRKTNNSSEDVSQSNELDLENRIIEQIINLDEQLETHFKDKLIPAPFLTRKIVSFQGNKTKPRYRWYKYKEAFSADLVEYLITQYLNPNGQKLLDPFAGVGTTLFVGSQLGIESHGIELLAIGQWVIKTRYLLENKFTDQDFKRLEFWKNQRPWKGHNCRKNINELRITQGAYPAETQILIETYLDLLEQEDDPLKSVIFFVLLCVLEDISYTRKDGQYLRWDARVDRAYGAKNFTKDKIIDFETAICNQIQDILEDTYYYHELDLFRRENKKASIHLKEGSCLDILPTLETEFYDIIITSPPYCNRYDYTRTYALELAMLGISEEDIIKIMQSNLPEWVKETPCHIRQNAIFDAHQAYIASQNCQFRSCKAPRQTLKFNNSNYSQGTWYPRLTKGLYFESAEDIPKTSPYGTQIIKTKSGEWFAIFVCPIETTLNLKDKVLALDPGVRTFLTGFDGQNFLEIGKGDIGRINRLCTYLDDLMGRISQGKGRQKAKMRKASQRLRDKIRNLVDECHKQVANYLVSEYKMILLPTFETSEMTSKKKRKIRSKTARNMLTWAHYRFKQVLKNKAELSGCLIVDVTEEFTSKTCSRCGHIHQKLGGSKLFKCPECGHLIGRDLNGALGIMLKALSDTTLTVVKDGHAIAVQCGNIPHCSA